MNRARFGLGVAVGAALAVAAAWGCAARKGPPAAQGPRLLKLEAFPGAVVERACVPTGPEQCFNARDDNCNGIIDEGCGVNTGLVQFAAAWTEPKADVDLRVVDPNGELVEAGRATQAGLVKDRDCPGKRNECRGQNMENVYLEAGDPERGKYQLRIRLEDLGGETPPIRVTVGARVGPKTYALEVTLEQAGDERALTLEL